MKTIQLTAKEFLAQNQKTDLAELIFWETEGEFVRKKFSHTYTSIDDVLEAIKKPFLAKISLEPFNYLITE